tara:strand:+ start:127 stop:1140 length:1014 start_codon:yes stop_codon:yes gene_type:complete
MKNIETFISHGKNLFKDNKFVFDKDVKKIRIDIGLSKEAVNSAEWLLEHDDIGVIGIEANPLCHEALNMCTGTNSYINSLYLHQDKICKFMGYVSEVWFKEQILQWPRYEYEGKPAGLMHGKRIGQLDHKNYRFVASSDKVMHVAPMGTMDEEKVFRLYSVLEEIKDIKNRFCLLGGAVDNISGSDWVLRDFYSAYPNIGCSSLIRENIEANERGATDAADQFNHINTVSEVFNVPCFSLDAVLEHINWDTYPFIECIKIDVEGKDLDVLKSCKKYMDRVVYFRAEAHAMTTMFVKAKDMVEFMNENNFELFDPEEGDYKFINKKYKKMAKEMNLSY